jgi:hypothetical protein
MERNVGYFKLVRALDHEQAAFMLESSCVSVRYRSKYGRCEIGEIFQIF